MKQLLVRNVDEPLVKSLKELAAKNGISAEEQHRRLLREGLDRSNLVKEPLATYLVQNPVAPDEEIVPDRSREVENRKVDL